MDQLNLKVISRISCAIQNLCWFWICFKKDSIPKYIKNIFLAVFLKNLCVLTIDLASQLLFTEEKCSQWVYWSNSWWVWLL